MALQSPFFNNKRDPSGEMPAQGRAQMGTMPLGGSSTGIATAPSAATAVPASPAVPATIAAAAAASPTSTAPAGESESRLTVGPNIKLKGVEITDCDTLVVEGSVEATMDSRVIQIAQRGSFRGSAEIDLAEIRGHFDGSLTVRDKLVIYSTGRVSGRIRYGKIVIEEGGQLSGEIESGTATRALQAPAERA